MGVYIDMEMPTSCDNCWALDDYGDYPRCRITKEQRGYNFPIRQKRMNNCPLAPVPAHGRLIDADAYEQLLYSLGNRDYRREKGSIKDAIKFLHSNYTPTIIPAEKGTDIHKEFMQNSHEEVE